MLANLVLLAALSAAPNQADPLALSDVRITAGILGPVRPRTTYLPGDNLVLSFEIDGITLDEGGKARYSTRTEILDSKGKVLFQGPTRNLEGLASLGGSRLQAYAQVDIGLNQPPGEYLVKVTVTDRANKQTQTLTHTFTVEPKGFGVVRPSLTCDPEGQIPAGLFIPGQSLWINFAVVGFARDAQRGQPQVTLALRILDDKGQPTLAKPFEGTIETNVPADAGSLPGQFLLSLNRAGKFTIELTITDRVAGKTIKGSYPFTVQARH